MRKHTSEFKWSIDQIKDSLVSACPLAVTAIISFRATPDHPRLNFADGVQQHKKKQQSQKGNRNMSAFGCAADLFFGGDRGGWTSNTKQTLNITHEHLHVTEGDNLHLSVWRMGWSTRLKSHDLIQVTLGTRLHLTTVFYINKLRPNFRRRVECGAPHQRGRSESQRRKGAGRSERQLSW